jgi:hypothetical protein
MVIKAGTHQLNTIPYPSPPELENPQIRRIFNHDIMHCTAEGVEGNHLYSARALGMTHPDDIIQLHPLLQNEWPYIQEHYRRIGLTHATEVIWSTELSHLANNTDYLPSVFFFGVQENRAHPNTAWLEVVRYINSKNNFVQLAEKLGVPIPKTFCFDRADELNAEATEAFVFPCYLKAAISVSGVGIHRCENPAELLLLADQFDPATPIQVQEEVKTDCFLNMQYVSVNGECRRLQTTEQILIGPTHQGNFYPPRSSSPWDLVEPMAEWLTERGLNDVFAFDVAVIKEKTGNRYLAIECNPRFNGASYPTAIALKLDIPEWEARNYKTWHKSLSEIDLRGLEYHNSTGEGVIIVNWGPILEGKLMIMLAGNAAMRKALEVELRKRLW